MTTRRKLLMAFGAGVLAAPLGSFAQQQTIWRIGLLNQSLRQAFMEVGYGSFIQGMRGLGYVEDRNLLVEWRFAEDRIERLPDLAAELVRLKVDLIFAWATPAALAAKRATSTIPIVIFGVADPVGSGIVESLARPGGNITGVSNLSRDLSAKQVQLLTELAPRINRVAVLRNPANVSSVLQLKEAETAVRSINLQLQVVDVRSPSELDGAFTTAISGRGTGLVVLPDPMFLSARQRFADLTTKHRLPTVFGRGEHVETGGLASYGPRLADDIARAAGYVDRIFKGAKPGDLPIEQPTKFELAINLKTAKTLGLTIPQSILVRADRVIE